MMTRTRSTRCARRKSYRRKKIYGSAAIAADIVKYAEKIADKVIDDSGIDEVVKNLEDINSDVVDAENRDDPIDTKEIAADVKVEAIRAKKIIEKLPDDISFTDRSNMLRKIEKITSGKIRDILPAIDTLVAAIDRAHKKQMDNIDNLVAQTPSDTKKSTVQLYTYRAAVRNEYNKNKKWITTIRKKIATAIEDKDPDKYIKLTISSINISEYLTSILQYVVNVLWATLIIAAAVALIFGKNSVDIRTIIESVVLIDILLAGVGAILTGTLSVYRNFFVKKKSTAAN
jgi:hypothetical protein